jgi:hypothetical protein
VLCAASGCRAGPGGPRNTRAQPHCTPQARAARRHSYVTHARVTHRAGRSRCGGCGAGGRTGPARAQVPQHTAAAPSGNEGRHAAADSTTAQARRVLARPWLRAPAEPAAAAAAAAAVSGVLLVHTRLPSHLRLHDRSALRHRCLWRGNWQGARGEVVMRCACLTRGEWCLLCTSAHSAVHCTECSSSMMHTIMHAASAHWHTTQ